MKLGRLLLCSLLLLLLTVGCREQASSAKADEKKLVAVSGQVVAPLEGSYLYIYKQGMDLYGPAFTRSEATDSKGGFSLSLPEGEYVAVVRKRQGGEEVGPVVAGDHKSEFITLKVRDGMAAMTIQAPVKIGDSRRLTKEGKVTDTGLTGVITDADGNPVEGTRVQVYDHVQMSERPKYVSRKTGPDGRYLIHLPKGGTYYICARDNFGGPPKLGDLYGRYDQGTIEPSAVVIRQGELLEEIDIRVTKVW